MKLLKSLFPACLFFLLTACGNKNVVVDTNQEIKGQTWSYTGKVRVPVKVEDSAARYSIFINLRHTAAYRYANIFMLVHEIGPDGKRKTERKEFKLANPDGEWLGKGSGNLYSYQLIFKKGYRFNAQGTYVFELEQNMRDNPLREVTDAGIRVEKEE